MTVPSITDLFLGQGILEKTKLRPVWETVNVYLLRALVLVSTAVAIINFSSSPIRCFRPQSSNETYSTSDMLYVGELCHEKLGTTYRYSGLLAISWTILLYILNNWWKVVPTVRSGFLAVHKVNNMLGMQHLSKIEAENLVTRIQQHNDVDARVMNENKDYKVVRHCWHLLARKKAGLLHLYLVSCLLSIVVVVLVTALIAIYYWQEGIKNSTTFTCTLVDIGGTSNLKTDIFSCSNRIVLETFPYIVVACIIHVFFIAANIFAIYFVITGSKPVINADTTLGQKLHKDYIFLAKFSQYSEKLNDQTAWLITSKYAVVKVGRENNEGH